MAKGYRLISAPLILLFTSALSGCAFVSDADLTLCEEAIKSRLKAPATAVFSSWEQEEMDARLTSVRGEVDAENGFGAMIRSSFKCHVLDDTEATVMYID